jgi:hypothetical protein
MFLNEVHTVTHARDVADLHEVIEQLQVAHLEGPLGRPVPSYSLLGHLHVYDSVYDSMYYLRANRIGTRIFIRTKYNQPS